MERMDRARRIAGLAWVAAGVVFGALSAALSHATPGAVTLVLAVAVIALALAVAIEHGRPGLASRLGGWVVAVLLALTFGGAVADRFGAFGPPGAPGVSWGNWDAFVAYTRVLLLDPPRPLAEVAALGATVAEVALAVALAVGWQRRWVGKAAAGLLAVYLVAMGTSVGWAEVARYAIPIEIGGALLVTVCPARRPAPRARPVPTGAGPC